jgi:uncharacterized protein (DUF58 family)
MSINHSKTAPKRDSFREGIDLDLAELLQENLPNYQINARKKLKSRATQSGEIHSRFRGQGMEFEEVRSYFPGDDIRNIDWRVTARTGEPHTKVFRDDREQLVYTVLNQDKRLFFGSKQALKSVTGAKLAATLLSDARGKGHRCGAFLYDESGHQEFKPSTERANLTHVIGQITQAHNDKIATIEKTGFHDLQQPGVHLPNTLQRLIKVVRSGSQIHIISDVLPDQEAIWTPLAMLARHSQLQYYCLVDALDWKLPSRGSLAITDGVDNAQLYMNESSSTAYLDAFQKHATSIRTKIWNLGGEIHFIGSLPDHLRELLSRKG